MDLPEERAVPERTEFPIEEQIAIMEKALLKMAEMVVFYRELSVACPQMFALRYWFLVFEKDAQKSLNSLTEFYTELVMQQMKEEDPS
jgi:hypothetical protein